MSDDDDIAATLNAFDASSDDHDIASTLDAFDKPNAPQVSKQDQHSLYQQRPYADRVINAESGGNPNARATGSTAFGSGQFIDSTWKDLLRKHRPELAGKSDSDLLAMKGDPDLNRQMVEAYANDNKPLLEKAGVPINDATLYGAHWFGPEQYAKIYNADPMTPIESVIGDDAAKNNNLSGKTTDDAMTIAARKMELDYTPKEYSIGDTLKLAGANIVPSTIAAAKGVTHAIMHPIDTLGTITQLGKGLVSKAEGYADLPQNEDQKAQDEKLVDALAESYKEKYGTWAGFQNYLAHDPAGVAFDASTIAGGAGAALRGAGNAAEIAGAANLAAGFRGAANTAANISKLNPATPVSYLAKRILNPSIVDKAGNIDPKVDELIKKATNGSMSAADLKDPQIKQAFVDTVQKKPLSLAVVKEGLMKSLGLKAPRPLTTGIAAPTAATEHVFKALAENKADIASKAEDLAGTGNLADVGAALDQAHVASRNRADALYNQIRSMPGTFGSKFPEQSTLARNIAQRWKRSGITGNSFQSLIDGGNPQSAAAVKLFQDYWNKNQTLTRGGQFDGKEILAMRQRLNALRDAADGSDIKGVSDVINAYDQHIAGLSQRGFFRDPVTNRPVTQLAERIKAANRAYANHFNTYETMNGANNPIVAAVRKLKSAQGTAAGRRMPSGDDDLYTQTIAPLGKALMDPNRSGATYNALMKATGNSPSIAAYVKSALMGSMKGVKTPPNIAKIMADPASAVGKALSPEDLARARHLHAAYVLNETKPNLTSRFASIMHSGLGSWAARIAAAGLAGHAAFGPVGAMSAATLEALGESGVRAYKNASAMAGAPSGNLAGKTLRMAAKYSQPVLTAAHYSQDRSIQRASGGRVSDDALVNRLSNRWKAAKKATDATTKPLLRVDDNSIIRALDIAQEHL